MYTSLCFTFENCEYISFPFSSVKSLEVRNISESIIKTKKCIETKKTAQSVYFVIDAKENIEKNYIAFGGANPFERIVNCPDIVSVMFKYSDGNNDEIFVPYTGDETNIHQYSFIKSNGDLVINVKEQGDLSFLSS